MQKIIGRVVRSSVRTLALAGIAAALSIGAASAQTPSAPSDETIVVTARQRSEALKDAPLAVNAFTARTIAEAGIERPGDFVALTPNVTFIQTTNVGESQVHIRGVIQPRDTEPPFAYVVDGVLIPNPNAFNQELSDIQQIEVVKGPIGSIYGRNAIGGAIIINTRKPGPKVEGEVNGGYEFEGEEAQVGGFISGPIVADTLFARLTANYTDRKGYFDNITRNEKEDPSKETVIRGRAIWKASDTLEFDFGANYGKVDGYAFAFNNQFSGTPGFTSGVSTKNTSIPFAGNLKSFNDQERYGVSARMNWEVLGGSLTAFVAHNKIEESMGGEGAADLALFGVCPGVGPCPPQSAFFTNPALFEGYGPTDRDGSQYQERNQTDTSAEVRFTSDETKRFRYIVGAYYIDFQRDVLLLTGDFGTGSSIRTAPVLAVGQPGVNGTGGDNNNSAWAVFGQAAYDITDKLEASLALRYDAEERENVNTVPSAAALLGTTRSKSFERMQPRFSLRYKANDDLTVYATYGEGFRSGGFNPLGSRAAIIGVDGVVGTTVQDDFTAETSKSFEIGGHAQLVDGRLSLNAAVFRTEVENAHFFQFFPFSLSRIISIVQQNDIQGAEFDFNFRVNDAITLFGGGGILDSEIKKNNELPGTVGNKFPYTPDHSAFLGMQYRRGAFSDVDFVARLEWNRTGEIWFDTENTPGTARPNLDLLNARVGLENERWTATLFARNLTDETYNSDAVVLNVPPSSTFNFVTKGTPRTVGVKVGYKF